MGKRIATSVGNGAQVVAAIHKYLADHPVEIETAVLAQQPVAAAQRSPLHQAGG